MSLRRAANSRALRILTAAYHDGANASTKMPAACSAASQQLLSLGGFIAEPRGNRYFSASTHQNRAEGAPELPAAAEAAAATPEVFARLDRRLTGLHSPAQQRVFAVIEVGGTQYKVTPDDKITTEKLADVDVNDVIDLQRVLVLGSQAETIIGRPYILGASVTAAVEEQFLDGKVIIFHKRRRKNSRRTRGHRQPLTTLRILSVQGIEEALAEAATQP